MKIVGLTGGIATGKSTVAKMLTKKGIPVVDADALAHKAIEKGTEGYELVVKEFGKGILDENEEISRPQLGALVFDNAKQLKLLEDIVHPRVAIEMQKKMSDLRASGCKLAVYMVPLLFEKGLENSFEAVILVDVPEEVQIERLKIRNGFSINESEARIKAQMSREEKLTKTEYIIDNSISKSKTKYYLNDILNRIL